MADSSDLGPLPDYKNPPVVETVLGVQFDRLRNLKNAHLGAFWKTLEAVKWPTVTDAPLLPDQFEHFDTTARWAARGVQFQLTQDAACRLQIKNADGDRMIQVQNGRLHFNWLGEGDDYPRYAKVRDELATALRRFTQFVADENLGSFRPNQWEVTYTNRIPQGTVWNTPNDWGFFRPLGGVPSVASVIEGESFGGQWHFSIPPQRGRLHIAWQHSKSATDGNEKEAPELIRLTLTARGPIVASDDGIEPVLEGLDLGRATIVRSFRDMMSVDANRYWGLKHA